MKYIAILRGINVGGQKSIKMTDLKALYESQGFGNVATYIQTGNVIFESESKNKKDLKEIIEKAIEKKYAFHVPVLIRTNQDLEKIVQNCPYEEVKSEGNDTKILVAFLQTTPTVLKQTLLMKYVSAPERLIIQDNEAYLYCPNGYGKSKLTNTFVENKLGILATTRNWKSVKKLYELSI